MLSLLSVTIRSARETMDVRSSNLGKVSRQSSCSLLILYSCSSSLAARHKDPSSLVILSTKVFWSSYWDSSSSILLSASVSD